MKPIIEGLLILALSVACVILVIGVDVMNGYIDFSDDVSGSIIGDILFPCRLYYCDRPQGQTFFCGSDSHASQVAAAMMAEIKDSLGDSFNEIYPEKRWSLRIY